MGEERSELTWAIQCDVCQAWQEVLVLQRPSHEQWLEVIYWCDRCEALREIHAAGRSTVASA